MPRGKAVSRGRGRKTAQTTTTVVAVETPDTPTKRKTRPTSEEPQAKRRRVETPPKSKKKPLPLPRNYVLLARLQKVGSDVPSTHSQALDVVLSCKHKERSFSEVIPLVEDNCRMFVLMLSIYNFRKFRERHLAQIITVEPTLYNLSREWAADITGKPTDDTILWISSTLQGADKGALKKRRTAFKGKLMDLVKDHHSVTNHSSLL
jgi:hypothetical protein